jgi:hypothetical protein
MTNVASHEQLGMAQFLVVSGGVGVGDLGLVVYPAVPA